MNGSLRAHNQPRRLAAAGSALVIVLSTVSMPTGTEHHNPRTVGASAIQLQSIATPIRTAAATPLANPSGPTPQNLWDATIAVALTPVWYAAFPITLPGSIAFAAILVIYGSGTAGWQTPVATATVLKLGVQIYALGPLTYISSKLSALVPQANSAAAEPASTPAATLSPTPRAARQERRVAGGLAGSGRTASTTGHSAAPTEVAAAAAPTTADRTPPGSRTAKGSPTASTAKKHAGTAGSGRGANKKAQS
ncbi:hypothetical protein BayCH28_25420 [Mycolicibacterium sp. CH28]|uniref:hypothetical protein n=1 Tax=Mycolicibacterium sp. CH28 TaxID=2512237 RepID=UPI0010822E8D|nr:hypothetical protein [Mycolicibacterium sp. CH28]TGD84381.1 hypothetical protein BayCH28_25420 [Mycolicibacterium sp. CH28]